MTGRPDANRRPGKEIYISDYDGANQQRFTVNRSLNIIRCGRPTGGLLAFYARTSSGFPDIYVANWAQPGRALSRPATATTAIQNSVPAWSPDGTKIAFMSNRRGNIDIWVVNRDGTEPART